VNVAHRLGEAAIAGELLLSTEAATQAVFEPNASGEPWEARELSVKGRDQTVRAWSLHIPARAATAEAA
ncbi:MAG: hypothetical protein ACRDFR_08010, partial [Candidatus Limnocylindria bacterium]